MATPQASRAVATAAGFGAILLWGSLASLTSMAASIPVLQLTAMAFAVATLVGIVYGLFNPPGLGALSKIPLVAWLLGVYGLLGYHVVYFIAIRLAPPTEITVLNYSWPLLIVLMSGLLPAGLGAGRLRWWHVLGAVVGFAGAALVPLSAAFQSGGAVTASGPTSANLAGYALALLSAAIWASYSVGSRMLAQVPTVALTGACGLTAIGASIGHLMFETTLWPLDSRQWIIVLAQGLGPVGAAFYLWDVGMKHGNIRLLGVLAYITPLIATGLLVVLGLDTSNPYLWLAVALVVLGAAIASSDQFSTKTEKPED